MAKPTTTRAGTRPADSARRREILDAATEVFAEKGVVAATVRDIGARAGILSGSLYHHFASKEEMVAEILVPVLRSQVEAFDAIAAETSAPEQILRRLIGAAVAQTAADPHAARIIRNDTRHFGEMQGLDEVVRQQRAVTSRWTSAVKQGIARGRFRSDVDPSIVTKSIGDVVLGAYRFMRPMGRMPANQVAEQLARLILDGLEVR
ncbi:TetR/AcrR family transcriptional regulator [Acidiferrimicrobium sp. IK]|uniref:TetR/AcrR family transcriptional regulator n=1 Tax=Acidiferrimicrobium sp. IK TaxID=2871700 RepID=UPI0021CB3ED0|nr:TetR/AcrR family transcriptional regulator [Acidiferrimicrobium sp. IK]MCU4183422.1 TetR/AcrR family transcriptional regulator [Acidiferrimicrobium sp. IK]